MKKSILHPIVFLIITLICVSHSLKAQENAKIRNQILEAESDFLYEEYSDALPIYMKLRDLLPNNEYLAYKIGRCYLHNSFEYKRSVPYLKMALTRISNTKKDGDFKLNLVPIDVIFYLGDAYRINNQLFKAIEEYKKFKKLLNPKIYDTTLVNYQISACKRAMILEKKPVDVTWKNLGPVINTRFSESHPVVSEDENEMLYATQLPFYQAVFFARKVNGKWQQPVNIIPDLGIDGDCLPTCLSADGKEAYFYRSDQFRGDLYVSDLIHGKWSKIHKLNSNINTRYWESNACLSHDGKLLYFTSNRPGGYGGLDIYVAKRISVDGWGKPQNLGPVINSKYNEDAPFITADGKRLYFSSFGHETIGGYDIFYSDKDANGNWTKPVNLGYPVNTTGDDMFFCPVRDGKFGYCSVYDTAGYGRYDITRVEIFDNRNPREYTITGQVRLPSPGNEWGIHLSLYDKLHKDTLQRELLAGGQINLKTTAGTYALIISAPGYKTKVVPFYISRGSKDTLRSVHLVMDILPPEVESAQPKELWAEKTNPDSLSTTNPKIIAVVDSESVEKRYSAKNQPDQMDSGISKQIVPAPVPLKQAVSGVAHNRPHFKIHVLDYFVVGGGFILLILLWFLLKKRNRRDQN